MKPLKASIHAVVIVGGGFGGLAAAKALRQAPVLVTLVDRTNHHLFQPLLYQVAMAGLSPADIAAPIRSILNTQRNVTVLLGEATGIDFERRILRLRDGELPFDDLLLATGGRTSYFEHDLRGQPREPFRYVDKGTMATIGRKAAIVQFGRWKFSGFAAWVTWLVVHIYFLIGFRNRLVVLFNWAWSYFTYQRGARLITGGVSRPAARRESQGPDTERVE